MKVYYAHQHPDPIDVELDHQGLFLAGPSPRGNDDYNWRPEALAILSLLQFHGEVYVPLPENGVWDADTYDKQVGWELLYLSTAKVIAFWMPRSLIQLPGFTSNVEFGMYVLSGKIILGYPKGAAKMRYLHSLAERNKIPVFHTLTETLTEAVKLCN